MMRELPHVLIVDDEPETATLMGYILSGKVPVISVPITCSVTIAIGGEMALRLMQDSGPFDLVLTDAMMPGMSGFELARAIRNGSTEVGEKGTTRHVPISMLTALASSEDIATALDSGCNFVLSKPVDSNVLVDHVVSILKDSLDQNTNLT